MKAKNLKVQDSEHVDENDRHLLDMQDGIYDDVEDCAITHVLLYGGEEYVESTNLSNNVESMEASNETQSIDTLLKELIDDDRRLSKFQIIDEVVEKILELLELKGITEFDPEMIKESIEKWIPRESIKTETPPEFISRVYGNIRGVTMAAIKISDDKLYEAYRTWFKKQPKKKRHLIITPVPSKSDLVPNTPPNSYQSYCYRLTMAFYNKRYA